MNTNDFGRAPSASHTGLAGLLGTEPIIMPPRQDACYVMVLTWRMRRRDAQDGEMQQSCMMEGTHGCTTKKLMVMIGCLNNKLERSSNNEPRMRKSGIAVV